MKYYISEMTQQVVPTSMVTSHVHQLYDTKEEPEAILMSPAYLAALMEQHSKGGLGIPSRHQMLRIAELLECLTKVHECLDKKEWDSDTVQSVSELLTGCGLEVRDYNPGEGICISCGESEDAHAPAALQ